MARLGGRSPNRPTGGAHPAIVTRNRYVAAAAGALAIDASSPAVVSGAGPTFVTASFTPPAGSLIEVFFSGNTLGGTNPAAPSITDNLGVHLTYTLSDWQSRADSPNRDGQAAIWTAPVTSSAAMTITVTNNAAGGTQHGAMRVIVWTGQHPTTPLGAHGKSGSASASSISQSYTAQATGGWGTGAVCDWDAKGNFTAGAGNTIDSGCTGTVPTTQISFCFGRRSSADDVNTVSNTFAVNPAATSTNLNWVWLEILPAAVVTTSAVPLHNMRDRFPPPVMARRTRFATALPPQLVAPPPFIPAAQHPHFRLYASRYRSRSVAVVPPQITVTPPAFVPQSLQPILRAVLARRRAAAVPPAAQAPAPPTSRARLKLPRPLRRAATGTPVPTQAPPPATWRLRLRAPQLTRPDQVSPVPLQVAPLAPTYPPQALRPRVKFGRLWRGRQATPVPPQVVVQPPAYPPVGVRSHVKFWQAWRGHSATVAPPQIVLTPPAYPPQGLRLRARALRLHRGHQATPVPAQITVTPAAYVPGQGRRAATKAVMVRHGRAVSPPVAQAAPPMITRVRARLARMVRGRLGKPVPAQVVIPPPTYPPSAVRSKRQLWTWRRRKLTSAGWMVGAAQHSCDTTRPSAGTTTRPGSGVTAYATATTARPSSGTTARPNSGTTSPPCGN